MKLNEKKMFHVEPQGEDSLQTYLREIRGYPLLTREEEQELARRIKQGDEKAFEKLVTSNLRFVITIARKFQNHGLSLVDLINEGNLGLLRAVQKFDGTRGVKFISYAVWWIRQAILQALAEQAQIVRIPLNRAGAFYRVTKRFNAFAQELGREPTNEELARDLNLPLQEVRETLRVTQPYIPLDDPPKGAEEGYALKDSLPDDQGERPDETVWWHLVRRAVEHSLSTLKDREAQIIRLYYGLGNQESLTLEEIGKRFGITRERVRQIKESALERLRQALAQHPLWPYLN